MPTESIEEVFDRIEKKEAEYGWFRRFIHNHGIPPHNFYGNFKHPLGTVRYQWLCFRYGIRNLFWFGRAVWNFDTCDYVHMLELVRISALKMAEYHEKHGVTVGRERTAHQLRMVAELSRRIIVDNYSDLAGHARYNQMTDKEKRHWALRTGYLAQQDAEYLGKMLKYVQHWWD